MWEPAGHRVIVDPDDQPDKLGEIWVPPSVKASRSIENVQGTIAAIGKNAWKAFDDGQPWAKVGDRVTFAKYGGFVLEDRETKHLYRLLNDEDIVAVWHKGE